MHPICYLTGKSGFVEKTSVAMASNPACSLKQGMTRPKVMTQRGQRADGPSPARLTHRPQCPLEPRQPLKAEPRGPASSRALRPCRAGSPTGRPELPVAHVPDSGLEGPGLPSWGPRGTAAPAPVEASPRCRLHLPQLFSSFLAAPPDPWPSASGSRGSLSCPRRHLEKR
uniref:Uncharacterized protein n=1 Tax=Rangifer tarandus platyrhynchus TaxID=3082113 RepID=A0ACB0FCA1_RANTA|nr:unnamed protein product [Rangifer tarandus platyrhynchus]